MSIYTLPALDAPAEDWGRVAVALPGWRWMEGMLAHGHMGAWRTGAAGALAGSWPDPDDPATEGCLLALLGRPHHGLLQPRGTTLGRACIAAAAALGRWPGGAP